MKHFYWVQSTSLRSIFMASDRSWIYRRGLERIFCVNYFFINYLNLINYQKVIIFHEIFATFAVLVSSVNYDGSIVQ